MKIRDIAAQYQFDPADFERFALEKCAEMDISCKKSAFTGQYVINDRDVKVVVDQYTQMLEQNALRREAMDTLYVTTADQPAGLPVKKYLNLVVAEAVAQMPIMDINGAASVEPKLESLRVAALRELRGRAYDLGANAILGARFNYVTPPNTGSATISTTVCLVVTGNAVQL